MGSFIMPSFYSITFFSDHSFHDLSIMPWWRKYYSNALILTERKRKRKRGDSWWYKIDALNYKCFSLRKLAHMYVSITVSKKIVATFFFARLSNCSYIHGELLIYKSNSFRSHLSAKLKRFNLSLIREIFLKRHNYFLYRI